jgi:hypothetical protein
MRRLLATLTLILCLSFPVLAGSNDEGVLDNTDQPDAPDYELAWLLDSDLSKSQSLDFVIHTMFYGRPDCRRLRTGVHCTTRYRNLCNGMQS